MPQARILPSSDKRYFKEIGLILLIKLALLIALRLLFFSASDGKPDAGVTSSHLLGASVTVISPPSSEKRSSHDQ